MFQLSVFYRRPLGGSGISDVGLTAAFICGSHRMYAGLRCNNLHCLDVG